MFFREVSGVGGDHGRSHHSHRGLPEPVHTAEHQRADQRAVHGLRAAGVVSALPVPQPDERQSGVSRGIGRRRRPRRLLGHVAAQPRARLQNHHDHLHFRTQGEKTVLLCCDITVFPSSTSEI